MTRPEVRPAARRPVGVSLAEPPELEPEPGREVGSDGNGGSGDKKDDGDVLLKAAVAAVTGLGGAIMAVTRESVKS